MADSVTGDPRFFARSGPHSLAEVVKVAGGVAPERSLLLEGIAPLQTAGPAQVSFLTSRRYLSELELTRAGAVIVPSDLHELVPRSAVPIQSTDPSIAWARVAALFHPPFPASPGVHPSSVVAESACIDPTAEIGPLCVIESGATIGARCRIGPGAVVGSGVVVGRDCRIGANATVSHALLGDRVYVYPGARIGQEGFGFAVSEGGFLTVPQLGRVVIQDDVEIGANTTIDRGSARDTVIGAGSRLDNLVQIGHNVVLGRCCVIVAQVGISGSTTLEDFVQVGGQAAFAGHLHVGKNARIGAQAGVISDVPPNASLLGSPAQSKWEFFRQVAMLRRRPR
ncbi:UDP-3-O-[3-hydroxymyristoyl] glucosamine N-acyltransferase [Rhodoplanes tepidamans]|nr:UDP-3-O-[3-hydroxymyristoyl] glucosamine N-acyltransferase [Rhodoplanes tepidamans]